MADVGYLMPKKYLPTWHDDYENIDTLVDIGKYLVPVYDTNSVPSLSPSLYIDKNGNDMSSYASCDDFLPWALKLGKDIYYHHDIGTNKYFLPTQFLVSGGCPFIETSPASYTSKTFDGPGNMWATVLFLTREKNRLVITRINFRTSDYYDRMGFYFSYDIPSHAYCIKDMSWVTKEETIIEFGAGTPYSFYFELCGAGGGSAGSSSNYGSGGGGGACTFCGVIHFIADSIIQISIPPASGWGLSAVGGSGDPPSSTNGPNGQSASISMIYGADGYPQEGYWVQGGRGSKGTNDTKLSIGGAGGTAVTYKYFIWDDYNSKNASCSAIETDTFDIKGDYHFANVVGLLKLNGAAGGSGGYEDDDINGSTGGSRDEASVYFWGNSPNSKSYKTFSKQSGGGYNSEAGGGGACAFNAGQSGTSDGMSTAFAGAGAGGVQDSWTLIGGGGNNGNSGGPGRFKLYYYT